MAMSPNCSQTLPSPKARKFVMFTARTCQSSLKDVASASRRWSSQNAHTCAPNAQMGTCLGTAIKAKEIAVAHWEGSSGQRQARTELNEQRITSDGMCLGDGRATCKTVAICTTLPHCVQPCKFKTGCRYLSAAWGQYQRQDVR
jgi:hypothetical protein